MAPKFAAGSSAGSSLLPPGSSDSSWFTFAEALGERSGRRQAHPQEDEVGKWTAQAEWIQGQLGNLQDTAAKHPVEAVTPHYQLES